MKLASVYYSVHRHYNYRMHWHHHNFQYLLFMLRKSAWKVCFVLFYFFSFFLVIFIFLNYNQTVVKIFLIFRGLLLFSFYSWSCHYCYIAQLFWTKTHLLMSNWMKEWLLSFDTKLHYFHCLWLSCLDHNGHLEWSTQVDDIV